MHSQEGTPCLDPSQGLLHRQPQPHGSETVPMKIRQGKRFSRATLKLREVFICHGIWDLLLDVGEEHLGIAVDLWDV